MMPFLNRFPEQTATEAQGALSEEADGDAGNTMAKSRSATRGDGSAKGEALATRCAAIPARMELAGTGWARQELHDLLTAKANKGVLPGTGKRGNVVANLWFIRAAHEFADAVVKIGAPPENDLLEFIKTLMPICKQIIQAFIAGDGMAGVRMDDSGMLAGEVEGSTHLRLNALWYMALECTGQALRGTSTLGKLASTGTARDQSGNHFERLAGRFRRAFAKVYWCEEHDRICIPETRALPDHGGLPDPEQLLLTLLPASPLPRTKQREILAQFQAQTGDAMGVRFNHPEFGIVESPLYRAWLVQGSAFDGDTRQVPALIRPLLALAEAARNGTVFAYYREGQPVGRKPDAFVSAEIAATLRRFQAG